MCNCHDVGESRLTHKQKNIPLQRKKYLEIAQTKVAMHVKVRIAVNITTIPKLASSAIRYHFKVTRCRYVPLHYRDPKSRIGFGSVCCFAPEEFDRKHNIKL